MHAANQYVAESNRRLIVDVPARALFKIVGVAALLWCLWRLSKIILLLIVAVILAVALDAPVSWLERRIRSRTAATLLVTAVLTTAIVIFLWQTSALLISQWEFLSARLLAVSSEVAAYVPSWLYRSRSPESDWRAIVHPLAISFAQSTAIALTLVVLGFF